MLFKIFLIVFALFAIARTSKQHRKQKVTGRWFFVWVVFWLLVILVAFMPSATDRIAVLFGIERGTDLIVYTSLVILYYAMYRVLIRLEKQNRELTDLVRKLAIKNVEK